MAPLADATANFRWQRDSTPLSKPETVATLIACYLVAVLALRLLVNRPIPLPVGIAALHNAILCFGSLTMFLGTAYEVCKVITVNQPTQLLACSPHLQFTVKCQPEGEQVTLCDTHAAQVMLESGSSTWLFCLPKGTPVEVGTAHQCRKALYHLCLMYLSGESHSSRVGCTGGAMCTTFPNTMSS